MRIKRFKPVLIALFSVISLLFVFHTHNISIAQNSPPRRATFDGFNRTAQVYPNGERPTKSPNDYPVLKSDGYTRDQVWVAGDGRSWAHLRFWPNVEYQEPSIDPIVQVGTAATSTLYTFPCSYDELGEGVVAWGVDPLGSSGCEYITVDSPEWRGALDSPVGLKKNTQRLANGEVASTQVTITRSEKLTLIHIYKRDSVLKVDVLVGAVEITSLGGAIFDVQAGNRYVQSVDAGSSEPIDLNEAVDSPSVEDFLDEANWSPEVEPLLEDLQARLPGVEAQLTETEQAILDAHNELRAEVDVPSLSWSPELASAAQEWADTLSRENDFRHSDGSNGVSGAGENIAAGNSVGRMLRLWSREKENLDLSTGQCRRGETCGHYSQMIWRRTTELGCGVAPHRRYGNVMVCNYNPPGNVIGRSPLQ